LSGPLCLTHDGPPCLRLAINRERPALAQASDAIASFAREAVAPILVLRDDVEAALRETLGK
jgi:hypothetical protein